MYLYLYINMSSAPTFNIEIESAPKSILEDVIEKLSDKYTIEFIDGELSEIVFDDFKLSFQYTDYHSEYLGNNGKGITIQYQPYYSESMNELLPKLNMMKELTDELSNMDILSDYEVKYYTAGSTI